MNDIDIEHFKIRLTEAREQLQDLQGTREASTATVKLDQSSVGRLSRMDALQQQAMAQNNQRRVDQSLKRIEAALRRCEDGSYGYCLDCDELINPRRLELDPAAPLCIACAEARDG
ncbi:MAG: TraR/DksA family transcriptional regulator [Cellvibrionaceae bacterium]